MNYDYCSFNAPNCEKCPFADCKASQRDISRQEAFDKQQRRIERNQRIIQMREEGRSLKAIAEIIGVTRSTVSHVVRNGK